jgi:hypothetical protein
MLFSLRSPTRLTNEAAVDYVTLVISHSFPSFTDRRSLIEPMGRAKVEAWPDGSVPSIDPKA